MIINSNLIKLMQYLSTKITEKINAAPITYETDPVMGYSEYLEFANELLERLEDSDSMFKLIPATQSIAIITADLFQYAPFIKNYSVMQLSMFRNTLESSLQRYFESIVVPTTPVVPDPEPETPPTDDPNTEDPAPEDPSTGGSEQEETPSDNTSDTEDPVSGFEEIENPSDITTEDETV